MTRACSTTTRSAPLVPIETAATPGSTAPSPRLASGPSPAPTVTSPMRSVVGTRRGSCSGVTPATSSASGSQSSVSSAISPVPEAIEWSITHSPVSRWTTSSLIPTQRRASTPCSRNQASLHSGRHRMDRGTGALVQLRVLALDPLGLLDRPRVGPGEQLGHRAVALVEADQRVHRAGQRDRPVAGQLDRRGDDRWRRPRRSRTRAPRARRPCRRRRRSGPSRPWCRCRGPSHDQAQQQHVITCRRAARAWARPSSIRG